jgi:hypothetical protein
LAPRRCGQGAGTHHIDNQPPNWTTGSGKSCTVSIRVRVSGYCRAATSTGLSLSAQAAFALRVGGRDNVLVLQTGIEGWRKDAAYKPQ